MAGISSSTKTPSADVSYDSTKSYTAPLVTVTMLFFMWGFITCMNDLLIPKLKVVFNLLDWQAKLIQAAFFGAYFIISLIYFLLSIRKGDPIMKIGYKNGIIIGLVVAAIGCTLLYPAASLHSYGFILTALFILASGITILQIAANPFVSILGPPATASSRLNMTQAFNSLGTTIAPILGGFLIFELAETAGASSADSVKLPYLGLAAMLLVIAVIIKISKLPHVSGEGRIIADAGVLQYRHLVLGIVGIFMYVGGEVAIGSTLIDFFKLPQIAGLDEANSSKFLAFYWGGLMVGRFIGAAALAEFEKSIHRYLIIGLVAVVAFSTIYYYYGQKMAFISLGLIVLNIVAFLLGRFIPSRTLGLFASCIIILLGFTIFAQHELAMWSVIAIGLFNSIMFPTIFTLAIKGLGTHTSQGSSLLVMAIVGAALIPVLQGIFADITGNLQLSFLVPIPCYLFIVYYGFIGYKPNKV
ncbi:MAG: sugar MFS transporter, partial [Bacteroidota bacterium]